MDGKKTRSREDGHVLYLGEAVRRESVRSHRKIVRCSDGDKHDPRPLGRTAGASCGRTLNTSVFFDTTGCFSMTESNKTNIKSGDFAYHEYDLIKKHTVARTSD